MYFNSSIVSGMFFSSSFPFTLGDELIIYHSINPSALIK